MSTLTLADAKTHLNITVTTYDAELQTFIDAAEAALARRLGEFSSTARTDTVPGGGRVGLALLSVPAVSLTSVTPVNGTALDVTKLSLNKLSSVVTYLDGSVFPADKYTVVYQAGRTIIPADLLHVVKETVRHLWDTQRGGVKRPGSQAADQQAIPGAAYAFTWRVRELWAPFEGPGFA